MNLSKYLKTDNKYAFIYANVDHHLHNFDSRINNVHWEYRKTKFWIFNLIILLKGRWSNILKKYIQ
jgi:hypothetical protein